MKVIKKINNNVVFALNVNSQEIIVVGKGLGFEQIPYQLSETDNRIQHIFVNQENSLLMNAFMDLPADVVVVTEKIINMAKAVLHYDLNKNIIITLSDHISFAIERSKGNMIISLPFQTEISNIYHDEVTVAKVALEMIKNDLKVELPNEEVSLIALHFINAQHDLEGMKETYKLTETISAIMKIIEQHFKIILDEESLFYSRFATHLRFFVFRQKKGILFPKGSVNFLIDSISTDGQMKECVDKIDWYMQSEYGWICSEEEKLYLILHINSLVNSSIPVQSTDKI